MKPRIGVATLYTEQIGTLHGLTAPSKRAYCERWGYAFLEHNGTLDAGRPPAWSKLLFIKNQLASFDWIWWIDADAEIRNAAIDVESLLDPVHDLIVGKARLKDPFGSHNVNCGSFFIRNSPWSHAFLECAYAQEHLITHYCWEQAAICHMYETDPTVREKVRVDLDNTRYNSFASDYRKGHLLFHAVHPRRLDSAKEELLRRIALEDAAIDFLIEPEIRILAMVSIEVEDIILQSTLGSMVGEIFGTSSSPCQLVNLRHADFATVGGYAGVHRLWLQGVGAALASDSTQMLLVVSNPVQFFTGWERSALINLGSQDLLVAGLPERADLRLILIRNSPSVRAWFAALTDGFLHLPHLQQSAPTALAEYWKSHLSSFDCLPIRVGVFNPALFSDRPKRLGINIIDLKIQLPNLQHSSEETAQNFSEIRQHRENCLPALAAFLVRDNPAGFSSAQLSS